MSSATSPAASPPCCRASTSTPVTCARSPASSPTRSARRSRSCAPRSTTSNPSTCPRTPRPYLERARQGSERLNSILVAMGAATRVEEAIGAAERVDFDLVPLLTSAVAAYRGAFPERQFALEMPGRARHAARGAGPDRADARQAHRQRRGFQPAGRHHHGAPAAGGARGAHRGRQPRLRRCPLHVEGRLFESLWQSRTGQDNRPHFGLGPVHRAPDRRVPRRRGLPPATSRTAAGVRLAVRLAR